jgi:hypothetical protein
VTQIALSGEEKELVRSAVLRIRARAMALVFAMAGGLGLFVATIWLVIRGGPNVGQHLALLRSYFPGFEVTWAGSLVGFAYGALLGALIGWCIAWIYNRIADYRRAA